MLNNNMLRENLINDMIKYTFHKTVANSFNQYFKSVAQKLIDTLDPATNQLTNCLIIECH